MTDARATDAESRKQIVTDFDHTLFVEAGAGSGKTTAMVSRIMTVLLNGLADIREIAAITFTNEGAASLKSKIQHDLEKAAREGKYATFSGATLTMTAAENERIRKALSYLPLANFSTIHSFCLELLKERPVEAGIDPRFEMNTAGTAEPVFVEAWFRFLIDAARRKHQFLQFAVEEGLDLDGIQKMAEERCENPDLDLYTEKVKPISGKKIEDAFAKAFGLAKEMSDNVGELKRAKPTAVGARRIEFVEEYFKRAESCKSTEEKKRFLLEEEIFHKWVEKVRFFLECANGLQVIQDGLKKMNLDYIHLQIAAFIEEFGEFFGKYKRSSSALDFTDFLFLTREVLRNIREVREYFKGRFKYIFVDEMQDVDPLQTEILFFLAEAPGSFAAEWKDVKLVPSKLFMVGDPKQSIFRFRRADITMFVEVRELVRAQGGEILSLDKNFRSAVEIIEFVNDHFQESFEGYRAGITERLHPEYEKLSAAAPVQSKMPKHVFMLESLAGVANATTPDLLADELRKLNSFIREITSPSGPKIYDPEIQAERSILFSDIMLLLKNFTEVGEYTRFFEAEDIPHYEVGGRTFFDTEDVRALAFALKAIDDPTDTIALFGALKSPVFGIDDQMMFDYMSSGHKFNIWVSGGTSEDSLSMALNLFKELHYTREPIGRSQGTFQCNGSMPLGASRSERTAKVVEVLPSARAFERD